MILFLSSFQGEKKSKRSSYFYLTRCTLLTLTSAVLIIELSTSFHPYGNPLLVDLNKVANASPLSKQENGVRSHNESSSNEKDSSLIIPASMSWWIRHATQIQKASQHPLLDPNYQLENITTYIFRAVTPRLDLAIRSVPVYRPQQFNALYEKVSARLHYLQHHSRLHINSSTKEEISRPAPPPLRILVMGGSVAKGIMCNTGLPKYVDDTCSWTERLQLLLNYNYANDHRFEEPVVLIDNFAVGGMDHSRVV